MPATSSVIELGVVLGDVDLGQDEIGLLRLQLAAEGKAPKTMRLYTEAVARFAAGRLLGARLTGRLRGRLSGARLQDRALCASITCVDNTAYSVARPCELACLPSLVTRSAS